MSEQKIPIPAMLYNAAVGGHVTNSQQIIDENLNREQNDINQETVGAVPYNSTTPNGMGRIVLKKNDNFKEVVEAQTNGNTIFVIKYDFTLTGDVTVPANCVLEFDGGSVASNAINLSDNNIILNGKFIDCFVVVDGQNCLLEGNIFEVNNVNANQIGVIGARYHNFNNLIIRKNIIKNYAQFGTITLQRESTNNYKHLNVLIEDNDIIYKDICITCNSRPTETEYAFDSVVIRNNKFTVADPTYFETNTDHYGMAISIEKSVKHSEIYGNIIEAGMAGVEIAGASDVIVHDNTFFMLGTDTKNKKEIGVWVDAEPLVNTAYIKIFNNVFKGSTPLWSGNSLRGVSLYISKSYTVNISNNIFNKCGLGVGSASESIANQNNFVEISRNIILGYSNLIPVTIDGTTTSIMLNVHLSNNTINGNNASQCCIVRNAFYQGEHNIMYLDSSPGFVNGYVYIYNTGKGFERNSIGNGYLLGAYSGGSVDMFKDTLDDKFLGLNYYDIDKKKAMYWCRGRWLNGDGFTSVVNRGSTRPENKLYSEADEGFQFYDNTINKPIYAKAIAWDGSDPRGNVTWIESDGAVAGVKRSGTFAEKPSSGIYVGFKYFCTDKPSAPGSPIYYTGDNTTPWVYSDGTAVS